MFLSFGWLFLTSLKKVKYNLLREYIFDSSIGCGRGFDSHQLQASRDKPSRGDADFDRLSQIGGQKRKNYLPYFINII